MFSSQNAVASVDPDLRGVVAADNTEQALRVAINKASALSTAKRFVLTNQLRLRLAAVQMQNADFENARQTLREIEADSPAAPQASLLMAESYRLTGNASQARGWFLRTAKHYPYRPATLNGLISAAQDEQATNASLSAALYAEISTQSLFALEQLDQFESTGALDPIAVLFPSALDDAVRKTLLRRSLRHPDHNLLAQTGQLKQSVETILALRQQHETVSLQLNQLNGQLLQYRQQRAALNEQLLAGDQQVQTLTTQLIPNDFGAEQTLIRKRLTRLRNQQARLRTQLEFIEQSERALPRITHNLEQQLQTLHQQAQKQLGSSRQAVTEVLEATVSRYRSELSNLAAEAQLQRSELMITSH